MQPATSRDSVIAVLALAAVLIVSLLADLAVFRLRLYAEQSFSYMAYMWATALAGIVICALAFAVSYWLVVRASAHRLVGFIYLIFGGLIALYVPLVFTLHLGLPLPIFL